MAKNRTKTSAGPGPRVPRRDGLPAGNRAHTDREPRVALFVPTLGGGGAEKVMLRLAEGIAQRGLPVDLVVFSGAGEHRDHVPAGVRLVELRSRRAVLSVPALARYLRQTQPAALVSTLVRANLVAVLGRRLAGVPTRIVLREATMLSSALKVAPLYAAYSMPLLVRLLYREADAVIAVAQSVADELTQRHGVPARLVRVVYNPVISPAFDEAKARPVEHSWLKPGQPPVVLAAGRLDPPKDYPTLLRAFARVAQQTDARLLILGEGSLRVQLQDLIEQLGLGARVQMPGFVDNPYPAIAAASVFVSSSIFEGFPSVLVEAMGCGTLPVSTDAPGGASEILGGGRYGRLVPPRDPQALSDALLAVLARPPSAEESERLLQRAAEFSLARAVDSYLDICGVVAARAD